MANGTNNLEDDKVHELSPKFCCPQDISEQNKKKCTAVITLQKICETTNLDCPPGASEQEFSNLIDVAKAICVLSKDTLSFEEKKKLIGNEFKNSGLTMDARSLAAAVLLMEKMCHHVENKLRSATLDVPKEFSDSWEKYCKDFEIEEAWNQIKKKKPEELCERQDVIFGPAFMEGLKRLFPEEPIYSVVDPKKDGPLETGRLFLTRFAVFIVPPDMAQDNFCKILDSLAKALAHCDGRILVCSPLCLDLWTVMDEKHRDLRNWVTQWVAERKKGQLPPAICIGEDIQKMRYYHRAGESLRLEAYPTRLAVYGKALHEEMLRAGFNTVFANIKEVEVIRKEEQAKKREKEENQKKGWRSGKQRGGRGGGRGGQNNVYSDRGHGRPSHPYSRQTSAH